MAVEGRCGASIVLLATAAALAVACSSAPPKSAEQERADEATAERVYAALQGDPVFYFRDVDVSADGGVVRLSGYVWTTDALYTAQSIARRVPGVADVRNEMELEREGKTGGGDGSGSE